MDWHGSDPGVVAVTPRSRLSDATWTAFTDALRFIVVPLVLIDQITKSYTELKTAFLPEIELYIIFFGGMITAASTLEASNKPGTWKRLLFGLTALAFVCLWLFIVLGGGIAEFTYGPYFVRFDMSKIVYIMLFGVSLKGLLVYSTFSTQRHYLVDQERRRKEERAAKTTTARPRQPPRHKPSGPAFSRMSKMAFEVSHDESVGYAPPPPPPPEPRPLQRVLAFKECPVCGAKASPKEMTCKHCGAWFPKDTIR
jgi:hypothetical protein